MAVISISGTQGSGKSTLLNALEAQGVSVDHYKVSRAVQKELGATALADLTQTSESIRHFQELVFEKKYANDKSLKDHNRIILVERSFIDVAAYTLLWMTSLLEYSPYSEADGEWLDDFLKRCAAAQFEIYSGSAMIPLMPGVKQEIDPNRAKYEDADTIYDLGMMFIATSLGPTFPICNIFELDINRRCETVQQFMKRFQSQ